MAPLMSIAGVFVRLFQLKQLLETGLKLFQEHQKHAEHLVHELK
jgi:hypothetical protein